MNFEATISIITVNEITGKEFIKTEFYMVNAKSFGHAETLSLKFIKDKSLDGDISELKKSTVITVDKSILKHWFKLKAVFVRMDDDTGKLKRYHQFHLVSGNTIEEAIKRGRDMFTRLYGPDYEVHQSIQTPFNHILNY